MQLLKASQLTALQKFAEMGMTTPVSVFRRHVTSGLDWDEPNDYGSTVTYDDITPQEGLFGWVHSTPTPEQQLDHGMLVTFNTYRLFLPVGTDILPGDKVSINGLTEYIVSDTTNDETWPALLRCSLRLKE